MPALIFIDDRLNLSLVGGRDLVVEFAVTREPDAVLVKAEHVALRLDRPVQDLADGKIDVDVEIDERRGHDRVGRERGAVKGGADHQHALFLGGFERADDAFVAGRGHHVGALLDQRQRDLLAFGDVGERADIGGQAP